MIADDSAEQRLGLEHMLKRAGEQSLRHRLSVMPRQMSGTRISAPREGGAYVTPSKESFQDRTYPLVRSIYIFLNRPPGKPLDPKLKEFLRYVLSREGQETVERNGSYLPLSAAVVREQRLKLD
jgi:phosphate transport system substrate-binding protein